MTNEELLQQAKDQVAKDSGHGSWKALVTHSTVKADRLLKSAALLAIQKAREAKREEWEKKASACGWENELLRMAYEETKKAFSIYGILDPPITVTEETIQYSSAILAIQSAREEAKVKHTDIYQKLYNAMQTTNGGCDFNGTYHIDFNGAALAAMQVLKDAGLIKN